MAPAEEKLTGGTSDRSDKGIMTVTSTIRSDTSQCGLHPYPSVSFIELRHSVPSDVSLISPVADQLMRFISRYRNGDHFEIELALTEALANAIIHGNQGDPQKHTYVSCRCSTEGDVSITVRDEGQGFDISTVPDPTLPDKRLRGTGRGIYLMKMLMDEVCFEDGGAVVHMRRGFGSGRGAERETR